MPANNNGLPGFVVKQMPNARTWKDIAMWTRARFSRYRTGKPILNKDVAELYMRKFPGIELKDAWSLFEEIMKRGFVKYASPNTEDLSIVFAC